jgi:hypothetical protein
MPFISQPHGGMAAFVMSEARLRWTSPILNSHYSTNISIHTKNVGMNAGFHEKSLNQYIEDINTSTAYLDS